MLIPVLFVLLLPGPVFTCINIWNQIRGKERTGRFETVAFSMGILYTLMLYGLLSPRPWDEAVWTFGDIFAFHEIISRVHTPTVAVYAAAGFLSYTLLKNRRKEWPPLVQVLCISGLYVGILIQALFLVQLARHLPLGELLAGDAHYSQESWLYCFYFSLVPFNFILNALVLLVRIIRSRGEDQMEYSYRNPWLQKSSKLLQNTGKWAWYALLLLLPLLVLLTLVLLVFGQQADSAIRAFTETSDWTLSAKISPPPIEADAHYLCTVALKGDEKLVKPLRYGIRRGQRIVVNRQLCVANAFEQLLEERTPAFHRWVRHVYDACGYPLSLHLQTPLRADLAYLLMKPLEWCFLLVLYLFDAKPENRIALQYLPGYELTHSEREGIDQQSKD